MAAEKTRIINIHRKQKYDDRFIQVDYENLGKVFGKLTKIGSRNLYMYFMSNKDGFSNTLLSSSYANWLGMSYAKDGTVISETDRSKINKQIREGIKELVDEGYLVDSGNGIIYDFYEFGTKSCESNKKLQEEQKVPEKPNGDNSEQKVLEELIGSENNKKLLSEQKVREMTISSENLR